MDGWMGGPRQKHKASSIRLHSPGSNSPRPCRRRGWHRDSQASCQPRASPSRLVRYLPRGPSSRALKHTGRYVDGGIKSLETMTSASPKASFKPHSGSSPRMEDDRRPGRLREELGGCKEGASTSLEHPSTCSLLLVYLNLA